MGQTMRSAAAEPGFQFPASGPEPVPMDKPVSAPEPSPEPPYLDSFLNEPRGQATVIGSTLEICVSSYRPGLPEVGLFSAALLACGYLLFRCLRKNTEEGPIIPLYDAEPEL